MGFGRRKRGPLIGTGKKKRGESRGGRKEQRRAAIMGERKELCSSAGKKKKKRRVLPHNRWKGKKRKTAQKKRCIGREKGDFLPKKSRLEKRHQRLDLGGKEKRGGKPGKGKSRVSGARGGKEPGVYCAVEKKKRGKKKNNHRKKAPSAKRKKKKEKKFFFADI